MKRLIPDKLFQKQLKKLKQKHYSMNELDDVLSLLITGNILPGKYKDHALIGNWKNYRECHIRSNCLLIYRATETEIILVATGTHDDLFK